MNNHNNLVSCPNFISYQSTFRQFLNSNISQDSVATHLRYGGIFNDSFIANLLLSLMVKEL